MTPYGILGAMRLLLSTILVILAVLLGSTRVYADSPDFDEPSYGNLFLCGQHALAGEMRNQPYEALLEGARVLHTKGMCYRDSSWLTSWRLARGIIKERPSECISYYACQGYYLYETIDPSTREPIALAVHIALTETPVVARYHMDSADAPFVYWWFSPIACPHGYFVIGTMRFC